MAAEQPGASQRRRPQRKCGTSFAYDRETKSLSYTSQDGSGVHLKTEYIVGIDATSDSGHGRVLYLEAAAAVIHEQGAEELQQKIISIEADHLPDPFVEDFRILLRKDAERGRMEQPKGSFSMHVIVSTLSGAGKASAFFKDLLQPLLSELEMQENEHYAVHYTESTKTISELTAGTILPQANQGVVQRIILLSGDGGIIDILNSLHLAPHTDFYAEPMISILPMGTGNALAHSYGVTKDRTGGLATLARGVPQHLPVFKARFSSGARLLVDEGRREGALALHEGNTPVMYGGVVCSWGLHAGLVADSDTAEYRKFGAERFKMAAKEALHPSDGSEPHRYKAEVSLLRRSPDGNEQWAAVRRDDHAYVLATMVSSLEENFVISPASKPFDGHLRVVHFGHVDGDGFMRLMNLAYQGGKHVNDEFVSYDDVEGLRIEFQGLEKEPRWRRICIDGNIIRVDGSGWVEVRKDDAELVKLMSLS